MDNQGKFNILPDMLLECVPRHARANEKSKKGSLEIMQY